MKIAHFNTNTNGGAAIAARRLHESLVGRGVDSTFYFKRGLRPDDTYAQVFTNSRNPYRRIYRRVRNRLLVAPAFSGRPDGYELFSLGRLQGRTPVQQIGITPSIINLHWVANFVDYPSFFGSLPDNAPIVWTLHDMNPFTGGCHYSWECRKYQTACSRCPQLGPLDIGDLAARNSAIKAQSIGSKNLHIVADSYWLEGEARTSALLANAKSFRTIHYGLDANQFVPRDKAACRIELALDADALVISFGADGIANRRKGMSLLLDAMELVNSDRRVVLLVFGSGPKLPSPSGRFTVRNMGFVSSVDLMTNIYSASDMFIMPSLHEAFGQTCLEAMACGTPVVGFDTGGIPDMIKPLQTGLLATPGDVGDLAEKMQWMIENKSERLAMGKAARSLVEQEYTLDVQASKYMELYRSLCQ